MFDSLRVSDDVFFHPRFLAGVFLIMIAPFNFQLLNEYKTISNWWSSYSNGKYIINIQFEQDVMEYEKTTIQAIIQKNIEFIGLKILKYCY